MLAGNIQWGQEYKNWSQQAKKKGGGCQQIMDLNKDLTLNQLNKEYHLYFFQNGMSESQDLRLDA